VSSIKKNTPQEKTTYSLEVLLKLKKNCTEVPQGCDIPQELVVRTKSAPVLASVVSRGRSASTQTDSLETYQRNVQSLLNKLSPENFESISEKLKNTISAGLESLMEPENFLSSVVEVIFEKAVRESRYAESYSQLCVYLSQNLLSQNESSTSPSFKKLLLNKCQNEFETRSATQAPPNPAPSLSATSPTSDLDFEEIRNRIADRNNGVPQFIGSLFLRGFISEKIIHYCLRTLLTTDETDLLKFASLMTLIGKTIDHPRAKVLLDAYFVKIENFCKNKSPGTTISSRIRYKLIDLMDLRRNNWQSKNKSSSSSSLPTKPAALQLPPVKSDHVNKELNVQEGR
jgi:translation initiation factor 4G